MSEVNNNQQQREHVSYDDVCRRAAHVRAERETIQASLKRADCSPQLKQYLNAGLLTKERETEYLKRKIKRIERFNVNNFKFII